MRLIVRLAFIAGSIPAFSTLASCGKAPTTAAATASVAKASAADLFNLYSAATTQHAAQIQAKFSSLSFAQLAHTIGADASSAATADFADFGATLGHYGSTSSYLSAVGVDPLHVTTQDFSAGLQMLNDYQAHAGIFANLPSDLSQLVAPAKKATPIAKSGGSASSSSDSSQLSLALADDNGSPTPTADSNGKLGTALKYGNCAGQYANAQRNPLFSATSCSFWKAVDDCGGGVQTVTGSTALFDPDPDSRGMLDGIFYGSTGLSLISGKAKKFLGCEAASS